MKFKQVLAMLFLLTIISGCSWKNMEKTQIVANSPLAKTVTIDNKKYTLETAQTEEEKTKGLMDIKSLKSDGGMIFIYDNPDYLQFWMKNTLIPLQILFVDGCKIVDIQEMEVEKNPASPTKTYKSKVKADKAIELNKNSVRKNSVGQKIEQLCK